MDNNIKITKRKSIGKATIPTVLSLATIILVTSISTPSVHWMSTTTAEATTAEGFIEQDVGRGTEGQEGFSGQDVGIRSEPKAPMAVSQDGNDVYIVWWTNKSENWEVMFRASNDGGQTFGDKINLSNSTDTESQNAEIVTAGEDRVFVTWWETSPETGSSESVLRVSNDAGQTFGPVIMLGVNGTISTADNGNTTETAEITTDTTTVEQGGAELLPDEAVVPTEEET
jgi:hypothetical protein